ncbi:MAG: adenylate/guanylate cyclase domain-containing protein [candidate division NC10 bacterium]
MEKRVFERNQWKTEKVIESGIRHTAAWRVLEGRLSVEEKLALKGGIAVVGSIAVAAFDHYPTPFDPMAPGADVHLNLMDNILNKRLMRKAEPLWGLPLIAGFSAAAYALALLSPLLSTILFVVLLAAWVAAAYSLFLHLWLLECTAPTLALAGVFIGLMLHRVLIEEKQKREVRQMFGQYVSPDVVDILVKDPSKIRLGGDKRDMTIFFLDIAHFTTISEKMTPENLIKFLNTYFTELTGVILKNKGVVDKYIGDCVMAFWNAPVDVPDHRQRACTAAIECVEAIARLNVEYVDPTIPEKPAVRIGLNSGEVVVGNTGSAQKLAYTVLGDDVNLASRLEGANKFFGSTVMVSEATYGEGKAVVEGRILGSVRVVGKAIPIKVFELLAKKGKLSEAWQKGLPAYEDGVALYLKRDFAGAKARFQEVLGIVPGDKPSKLYLSACEDYVAIPPPQNWDGVFNLTAK